MTVTLGLFSWLAFTALAASPAPLFRIDTWDTSAGLPVENILALAQTADGFLWVGTAAGLARFDGVRFEVFTKSNTPALGNNVIQALAAGRDGSLWIGTAGAGLVQSQGGAWRVYTSKEGLPGDLVLAIQEDAQGRVWAGTNKGLAVLADGQWRTVGVEQGVNWPIYTLDQAADNTIWAGGVKGLAHIKNEQLELVGQADLQDPNVSKVHCDRNGAVWVATADGRLYSYANGVMQPQTNVPGREAAHMPSPAFQALLHDSAGRFWLGSLGGGLVGAPEMSLHSAIELERWSAKWVYALLEDRAQNIWAATGTGLVRLRLNTISALNDKLGLRGSKVRAVYQDNDGTIWVGSEGGLFRWRESGAGAAATGRLEAVPNYPAAAGDVVSLLAAGPDLLVGTVRGGLLRWRGGRFEPSPATLSGAFVAALFQARSGRLFVGTAGKGVQIFEGERELPSNSPGPNVRQFAEDAKGVIWAATFTGLARYENGNWTTLTTKDGLASDIVMSVHRDAADRIWIGTIGGLSVYENGRLHSFKESQGMTENPVYSMLEDAEHVFWLGTGQGILRINRADLVTAMNNAAAHVTTRLYDRDAGMLSAQCSGGTSNVAWLLNDGSMLFGTAEGAAWLPAKIASSKVAPVPLMQEAFVDGSAARLENLRLPAGARTLELRYSAADLAAPNKLKFRYRLEGFDPDWVNAGTRRTAIYTNLPAGSYRFHVEAINEDGVSGALATVLPLQAIPYFYKTWWFYLLCLLAAATGLWLFYQYRVRQLQLRHAAVLTERSRIAKDLHDTLLRGFTGVRMQLMAASRTFPRAPADAKDRLDGAINLASNTLTGARHAIWDMRPPALESQPLIEALRTGCRQACPTETRLGFSVNGSPLPLAEKTEVTLLRAAQESVANAVRHGQATAIQVQLDFEPRRVSLLVQDDGCGFTVPEDLATTAGHWGLLGMKQRVESLGGTFRIDSETGSGTRVNLAMPA